MYVCMIVCREDRILGLAMDSTEHDIEFIGIDVNTGIVTSYGTVNVDYVRLGISGMYPC